MDAIVKIRDSKKRPDLDSIFHDISRNEDLNIDKDSVQILISKFIDSNVITVKKTKQGQKFLFLTKDAIAIPIQDNTVSMDSLDTDLSKTSNKPKDSGNTKPNSTSNHNYVSLELFNTFYDDYIEYKHYVNVVYSLRVISFELRVVSCDFRKINLLVVSSFLRVAK